MGVLLIYLLVDYYLLSYLQPNHKFNTEYNKWTSNFPYASWLYDVSVVLLAYNLSFFSYFLSNNMNIHFKTWKIINLRTTIYEAFYFVMVSMKIISFLSKDKWLLNWTQNQKRKLGTSYCPYFKSACLLLTEETQILRRYREVLLNKHL